MTVIVPLFETYAKFNTEGLSQEDILYLVGKSDKQHWFSCALHNRPAFPVGPCDCGGYKPEADQ